MKVITAVVIAALIAAGLVVGFGLRGDRGGQDALKAAPREAYGELIGEPTEFTSVAEITRNPTKFIGNEVTVKGKIAKECPSGCWFYLEDEGVQIYVDLSVGGMSIDQYVGREVTVQGTIEKEEDTGLMLTAWGLLF